MDEGPLRSVPGIGPAPIADFRLGFFHANLEILPARCFGDLPAVGFVCRSVRAAC